MAALAPVRLCHTISRRGSDIAQGCRARLSIVNHAHLSARQALR
jgi:hypothetical protein